MPVYLVLNEGVWRVRRLADLLFRVPLIDAHSEVIGPFEPPADAARLPEFIRGLRATLVARLAEIRGDGRRALRLRRTPRAPYVARGATLGVTPWRCGWHVAW